MLDSDAITAPDSLLRLKRCKDAVLRRAAAKPVEPAHATSPLLVTLRTLFSSRANQEGCENLPISRQGALSPCDSTESGASPQQAGSSSAAQQLLPTPSADVCDIEIDVSSHSHNNGGGTSCCPPSTHTASAAAAAAISPGLANSSSSMPCAQQPPLRRKTTSNLLAVCATKAHQLSRQLSTVLRPAAQQQGSSAAAQQHAHERLPWLPGRGSKPQRPATSLQPLTLRGQPARKQQPRRAASVFEATGRENIRYLLGPHAVCGSVTRYKMLMMAEQVHETHLQAVLSDTLETTDWAGEPAWEADFSVISEKYGQRVRQFLFWWGGALANLRWNSDPEEAEHEEPAAKVSVVVSGEQGAAYAAEGAMVKLASE